MTRSFRSESIAVIAAMMLVLVGCGGGSGVPKPTPVGLLVNADAGINPNEEGEPSPVVVQVFELKDNNAFNRADYFDFVDNLDKTLGADLIATREYELTPGKSEIYDRDISGDALYLGVIAGFRNIKSAKWRDSIQLNKGKKNSFIINLTSLSVRIEKGRFNKHQVEKRQKEQAQAQSGQSQTQQNQTTDGTNSKQ